MTARPNLFNIPAGVPFLDVLAESILNGTLPCPGGAAPSTLELIDLTLYLPNRRACRAMRGAFLKASGNAAMLLPRIRPLGFADEEALLIGANVEEGDERLPEIAAAVAPLERRMALASLILKWLQQLDRLDRDARFLAATPATALGLADELINLLDEAQSEQIDLQKLQNAAPERFASHWQLTLDFLKIAANHWPHYLKAAGVLDPIARRNAMMSAVEERLKSGPHPPVIIAGSTGSIPATASLMKTVLAMPNGAVVLPGLDAELEEESWQHLPPEHPQFGLRQLLGSLGCSRSDVKSLPCSAPPAWAMTRQAILREALRPPQTAGQLSGHAGIPARAVKDALKTVSLIEAATPHEEAWAVALILRSVAENPDKTASLVTPDRQLARRVAALLKRWKIDIVDSGGEPLNRTMPGVFMSLILEALQREGGAMATLALLKHPLCRLGLAEGEARKRAEILDIAVFRSAQDTSIANLPKALKKAKNPPPFASYAHPAVQRLTLEEWRESEELAARLSHAFAPLLKLWRGGKPRRLADFAAAHQQTASALAADAVASDAALWADAAGEMMRAVMAELQSLELDGPPLGPEDYPSVYRTLTSREIVRPPAATERLAIWGPLEARLQKRDVLILSGLNETTWPQSADPGPWLNRAMRASLGFQPVERRIGQAAHDFCQAFGASQLYLTRAEKVDGTPAVKCRWLMRLEALLEGMGMKEALSPDTPWLTWARRLHEPERRESITRPRPRPPLVARPRRLSVSAISTFITNPYAIYARHILRLEPVAPITSGTDARGRGQIIHAALAEFSNRFPDELPEDIGTAFLQTAADIMAAADGHVAMRAFWQPRLERFARWFAETEPARREGIARILSELKGEVTFEAPAGPFTLTARADRIDIGHDGSLAIYDYKTGSIPSKSELAAGRAPQLPLESFIALEGGFQGLAAANVTKLVFISAKGGEPPGVEFPVEADMAKMLTEETSAGLKRLIARFDRETTPYTAVRRPAFAHLYRYDEYEHLARVREWASAEGEAEA